MRKLALLLVVFSTSCKSESKTAAAPSKDKPPAEAKKETAQEIAKQPRTAVAGKTGFLEFTIELPPSAGMPIKGDKVTSVEFKDSRLELMINEQSTVPSQQSGKGEPKPRSDEKRTQTLKEEANGYLVVNRKDDATELSVEYCRDLDPAAPPSGICCGVRIRSDQPIVDIDKLIEFGEQVCRSIKVQNRTTQPAGSAQ